MEGAAFRCKSIEIPSPPRLSFRFLRGENRGGKKIYIYIYKEKGWWKIVLAADRRSAAKFPGHSKFSERRIKRALSLSLSLQARQGLIQLGWLPLVSRMAL